MEYKLCQAAEGGALQDVVSQLLAEGWVCQGGVSVALVENRVKFCQAMTKQPEQPVVVQTPSKPDSK